MTEDASCAFRVSEVTVKYHKEEIKRQSGKYYIPFVDFPPPAKS